jgi:hypothetical protein
VGESVITIFEHRTDMHTHGLDEARHVQIDHVAMKMIYPALAAA